MVQGAGGRVPLPRRRLGGPDGARRRARRGGRGACGARPPRFRAAAVCDPGARAPRAVGPQQGRCAA
eukprot:2491680-Lingulodinium_polyedra.AAC.1